MNTIPSVKWTTITDFQSLTFLNKDVIVGHNSTYILFHNLFTHHEQIYVAENDLNGDGVECLSGHKNLYIFGFADRSNDSTIRLLTYPDFKTIVKLKDNVVKNFIALEFTGEEYIVALSAQPNCKMVVWCWRTEHKLICYDSEIESLQHKLCSSSVSSIFLNCWDTNFCLWEIIPTYKSCLLHNRLPTKDLNSLFDFVWSNEGNLYAIDICANFYSVVIENLNLTTNLEWTPSHECLVRPSLAFYKNGFIIFGPDNCFHYLKKNTKEWLVSWSFKVEFEVLKILFSSNGENLVYAANNGDIIKIQLENDNVMQNIVTVWQRGMLTFDLINPNIDEILSLHSGNVLCIWKTNTGILKSRCKLNDDIFFMQCHPSEPIVALALGFENKYGIGLFSLQNNVQNIGSICLTNNVVDKVVWSDNGEELLIGAMKVGQLFYLSIKKDWCINVLYNIDLSIALNNMWIWKSDAVLLFVLECESKIFCYDPMKKIHMNIKIAESFHKVKYLKECKIFTFTEDLFEKITIFELKLADDFLDVKCVKECPFDGSIDGIYTEHGYITIWDNYTFSIIDSQHNSIIKKFITCHRFGEELDMVISNMMHKIAITLTKCGNMTVISFKKNSGKKSDIVYMKNYIDYEHFPHFFNENTESWYMKMINENTKKEYESFSIMRNDIIKRHNQIHEKLTVLLNENQNVGAQYKLNLDNFRMCPYNNRVLFENAKVELETFRISIENQIKEQDEITNWIKSICWDPVETLSKELYAIFSNTLIENYSLIKEYNINTQSADILKLTEVKKHDLLLLSWKKIFEEKDMTFQMKHSDSNLSLALELNEDTKFDIQEQNMFVDLAESTASNFINGQPFICSQMLLHTFMQMFWCQRKIQDTSRHLQLYLNEKFEELMKLKSDKIKNVISENARLKFIISELNILNKFKGINETIQFSVEDPTWKQKEIPKRLITIEPEEINVSPYMSLSDISKSVSENSPENIFYENKLIDMMDGALEKLWEEEIKKPIKTPKCMIDKNPEEYTDLDMIDISNWEDEIQKQEISREQYRNMLCSEYNKRSHLLNESIDCFNEKVDELYLLKLKIDSAISQEEFKMMLLRVYSLERIEAAEKNKELEFEMNKLENDQEQNNIETNTVQNQSIDCHAAYEVLASRDRMLDKNFKSNLGDVSPMVLDLCYKLFKKRPKWYQKPSMTAGVLYEMANSLLSKERSHLLHNDCLEYLKGVDQMDSLNNMPTTIDETVWSCLCKLRRIKIENEIKMRAVSVEITEIESACAACQKKNNLLRINHQKLKTDITNHRIYMERHAKDVPMQLIVKSGLVEIDMTGHLEDFEDAILVKHDEIEVIEKQIQKAAQKKINSQRSTYKFKKRIIDKEWEHATLKMKVKQLEDDLSYFERIKVTKEIQSYMKDKGHFNKEEVEKKAKVTKLHFNKKLLARIHNAEEIELKVGSINSKILSLENLINRLKRKNEERQKENGSGKSNEQQNITKRISLFITRNKLLNEIQKQHSTIILLQTELELQRLRTYPTLTIMQSYY